MSCNRRSQKCAQGDPMHMTIPTQYLTTFANRTYSYRVLCIQSRIAFYATIKVKRLLSPLVPDFENEIREVKPEGVPDLWDALKKAALSRLLCPAGRKNSPTPRSGDLERRGLRLDCDTR
jgi:hypothetical protein